MQITKYETREEWLDARKGKVTGSKLSGLITKRGNGKKKGYYELIADRLASEADDENPMDRGTRLEEEALSIFSFETGKSLDTSLLLWTRDDNENIAISPDAVVKGTKNTEAVEVKCLNSASHIEALLTNSIPSEYQDQVIQYFVVNDKLKKLNFVFYDPRMSVKKFFFIEVDRESVQEKVDEYLEYEKQLLEEIEQIVISLTF